VISKFRARVLRGRGGRKLKKIFEFTQMCLNAG